MATNGIQINTKAEPTPNGLPTLSDTLGTATKLHKAIVQLASGGGLQQISEIIDRIPQLQKVLAEKEHQVQVLTAQLTASESGHSVDRQKQLRIYNDEYDAWKAEKEQLQIFIEGLKKRSQRDESTVKALETDLKAQKLNYSMMETRFNTTTLALKETERASQTLKEQLRGSRADAARHSKSLGESLSKVTQLDELVQKNRTEQDQLRKDLSGKEERLSQVLEFCVPMKNLDLNKLATELEGLWLSATRLVKTVFQNDLPDEVLRNDWSRLRDNSIWSFPIPLPRTNSDTAKEMRTVAVLAVLARLVDAHIFQPTYLMDDEFGLRELLWEQAAVNQRKERFARSILLSMRSDEQESLIKEIIRRVLAGLDVQIDAAVIIPREAASNWEEGLETFLRQAFRIWQAVQCGKQSIEPSFTMHWHENEPSWDEFTLYQADSDKGKQVTSATNTDDQDDEVTVVFPRTSLADDKTKLITNGTVLRRAHLRVAFQEARKDHTSAPFALPGFNRSARRPSRAVSTSGESSRGKPQVTHFLSKPAYV